MLGMDTCSRMLNGAHLLLNVHTLSSLLHNDSVLNRDRCGETSRTSKTGAAGVLCDDVGRRGRRCGGDGGGYGRGCPCEERALGGLEEVELGRCGDGDGGGRIKSARFWQQNSPLCRPTVCTCIYSIHSVALCVCTVQQSLRLQLNSCTLAEV